MVYQYLMGPQGQAMMSAGQRAVAPLQRFANEVLRGPKLAGEGSTGTPSGNYGFNFSGRQQQLRAPTAGERAAANSLRAAPAVDGDANIPNQELFDQLTARGAGGSQIPQMSVMDSIMANRQQAQTGGAFGDLSGAFAAMGSRPPQSGAFGLQGFNMPAPVYQGSPSAAPAMPMGEPGYSGAAGAMVPAAPEAARRTLPGRTPGFLDQLLSGPDYQSNNMPVNVQAAGPAMQGQQMPNVAINWGDSQNPADFFRADQALRQNPQLPGFLGGF